MSPWEKSFALCVKLLGRASEKLNPWFPGGMDYVKINVILFCIILPIVLGLSLGLNLLWLFGQL